MRIRRFTSLTVSVLLLTAVGCSEDPAATKQRHVERGDRYMAEGKPAEAALEFRIALQADPRAGDVRAKLADLYVRTGEPAAALREYVRAADLLPDDVQLQLRAGMLLLYSGQFEDAKARAEKVLARDERHAEAHILKANALIGLKDLPSAMTQIEDAIKSNPDRGEIYANLGAVAMGRGQRDEAERAFRRAAELAPQSPNTHLALGNFYWLAGEWAQAEQALTVAHKLAPRDPLTNRALANYYLASNKLSDAEAPLKTMLELTKSPVDAFALADYYVMVRNSSAAEAILKPLESGKDQTTSTEASIRLATILYRTGKRPDAMGKLQVVLAREPNNEKALLVNARFLLVEKRPKEALGMAQTALAANPKSTAAYALLARAHLALGQPNEAIRAYGDVLRLNPRATDAQIALSQLQLARGETDASLSLAREALLGAPLNADAQLVVARALIDKNELNRAEIVLNALAKQVPDSAAVHTELGMVFGRKENLAAARRHFERALTLQPGSNKALAGLMAAEMKAGRITEARALIERSLSSNPTAANLVLAARLYTSTKDPAAAERFMKRAIERDPGYLPAYVGLGQLYIREGRLSEARAEFEKVSQGSQTPVVPMTMVGVLYEAEGNIEAARRQFERVVAMDPRAAVASNNLAWIYAQAATNLDKALELATNAVREMPDDPSANDTLGYVLQLKGLHREALKAFLRSVEAAPSNALYRYHLGKSYAASGDPWRAKEALTLAVKLDPDFAGAADAKQLLAQLKE